MAMLRFAAVVAVIFSGLIWEAKCDWSYMVMSPGELKVGMKYQVSVAVVNGSTSVQVSLKTKMDNSGQILDFKTLTFSQGGHQMVNLAYNPASSDILSNVYLHVEGFGASPFRNVTRVKATRQTSFMVIQTDKPFYKPSQTIFSRVLVMDAKLRPHTSKVDVAIMDPSNNKIEEWKELQTNDGGFVSLNMTLSDKPPLGVWVIEAFVSGNKVIMAKVNLTVAQYVLPRFEVTLTGVPGYVHSYRNRGTLRFKVAAEYTYGEPVNGKANVTLKSNSQMIMLGPLNLVKGVVEFSNVMTKKEEDTKNGDTFGIIPNSQNQETFEIMADVIEDKTGELQGTSGSVLVDYRQYAVDMKIQQEDKFYMPNSNYGYMISLTNPDGTPLLREQLSGTNWKLTAQYRYNYTNEGREPETVIAHPVDSSSISVEKFVRGNTLFLQFTLTLTDVNSNTEIASIRDHYAGRFSSKTNTSIQVQKEGGDTEVQTGAFAEFTASHPTSIATIYYVVYSRGSFTADGTVTGTYTGSGQVEFSSSIRFRATEDMSPSSLLIVYGFDGKTGELLIGSRRFKVSGIFKNQVTMRYNTTRENPGKNVALDITADSNSMVAVSAIDKSVLLLGKPEDANNIDEDVVMSGLGIFDLAMKKMTQDEPVIVDGCNCDTYTATRLLQSYGVNYMTNGYVHTVPVAKWDNRIMFAAMPDAEIMFKSNAASSIPVASEKSSEEPHTRRYFPETWIWINDTVGPSRSLQLVKKVPDSITSWITHAFALSPTNGLGIAPMAKLEAFLPMFIVIRMPYASIRGESLELKIQVFNYEDRTHRARVRLEHSPDFDLWAEGESPKNNQKSRSGVPFVAEMDIPSNKSEVKSVWVLPKKIGDISLDVTAEFLGTSIADRVVRPLKVKPEGKTEFRSVQELMKFDDKTTLIHRTLPIVVPANVVPDSLYVKTSLIGNVMGPVLDGLEGLVRMPFGCGEQNMISLVPNIYVRDYLNAVNELSIEIQEKTDKFMKYGYQRELTYRHDDGSFSAFGKSDPAGSTWLTGFVLKSFVQAKRYIFVDPEVIRKSALFLEKNYKSDGFAEPEGGRVIHSEMQGGTTGNPLKLTAYIVSCILEALSGLDADTQQMLRTRAINPAITLLKNNFAVETQKEKKDVYMLALTAYALALNNDTKANEVLQVLEDNAQLGNGTKFWGEECVPGGGVKPMPLDDGGAKRPAMDYIMPPKNPNCVEMASYVLLAYMRNTNIDKSQPIMTWLVSQMSDVGGFHSTQDTVLGLQALSTFASKSQQNVNINVNVTFDNGAPKSFKTVTRNNKNLLQRIIATKDELPRNVHVRATGVGTALFTVSWQYNVKNSSANKDLKLNVAETVVIKDDKIKIGPICVQYSGKIKGQMAIVSANMPTRFSAEILELQKDDRVKNVEINGESVDVYFDQIDEETCIDIPAVKTGEVVDIQPRSVTSYLYYAPEVENTVFYSPIDESACTPQKCPTQTQGPTGAGNAAHGNLILTILLIVAVILL